MHTKLYSQGISFELAHTRVTNNNYKTEIGENKEFFISVFTVALFDIFVIVVVFQKRIKEKKVRDETSKEEEKEIPSAYCIQFELVSVIYIVQYHVQI